MALITKSTNKKESISRLTEKFTVCVDPGRGEKTKTALVQSESCDHVFTVRHQNAMTASVCDG